MKTYHTQIGEKINVDLRANQWALNAPPKAVWHRRLTANRPEGANDVAHPEHRADETNDRGASPRDRPSLCPACGGGRAGPKDSCRIRSGNACRRACTHPRPDPIWRLWARF